MIKSLLYRLRWIYAILLISQTLTAKPVLLFYCGITMVPAMQSLIKSFEKTHDCTILIKQGGSGELLRTLTLYRKGDLFLPGSESYYRKADKHLFLYRRTIGSNRLALFVRTEASNRIHSLDDLLKPGAYFAIGDAQIGSVGRATRALIRSKYTEKGWQRYQDDAVYFGSDSRDLLRLMEEEGVEAAVNWKAASVRIPPSVSLHLFPIAGADKQAKKLVISLLRFSDHPALAKAFIDYTASAEGKQIMKRYGLGDGK
ncbi:substrate-binding domain-containing protein [Nitratifractor sp.]|uniref:substrate-binding domain-containing protein n=1 Tax=Nitratifractor sp. TaxID=2268144 RepID=UPI0025EDB3FB|nr:substrate-binding domain-containing protein [Nitratifractor sp.]